MNLSSLTDDELLIIFHTTDREDLAEKAMVELEKRESLNRLERILTQ